MIQLLAYGVLFLTLNKVLVSRDLKMTNNFFKYASHNFACFSLFPWKKQFFAEKNLKIFSRLSF